jgi:uncharacterized damage-inducible protein DinB
MDSTYFQILARYNRWANQRLYTACLDLSPNDYHADRSAYFKSIGNTLNHILVADRLWMARFNDVTPAAIDLSAVPHPDPAELWAERQKMDEDINAFFVSCDDVTPNLWPLLQSSNPSPGAGARHAQPCRAARTAAPGLDLLFP